MKAKKKTVYGSMKKGGKIDQVKPTAAQRKKRRLKRRADRKGVSKEGMGDVFGKFAQEKDDRKRDVFNPMKADRAEKRAAKAASKVGARLTMPRKAQQSGEKAVFVGDRPQSFKSRPTKELKITPDQAQAAGSRKVKRAQRKYDKYAKVMSKQGADPRPEKPEKVKKPRKPKIKKRLSVHKRR